VPADESGALPSWRYAVRAFVRYAGEFLVFPETVPEGEPNLQELERLVTRLRRQLRHTRQNLQRSRKSALKV